MSGLEETLGRLRAKRYTLSVATQSVIDQSPHQSPHQIHRPGRLLGGLLGGMMAPDVMNNVFSSV